VLLRRHYGYEIVRQTGSHMRLTTLTGGAHRVTVPAGQLRLGTLAGILSDIAAHHGITRSELEERLFN
jgi:predicted RNA binding protein YcfA (HicA-like mRNA interferase family)